MTDSNYAVLIYSKEDWHRTGGVYGLTRSEALQYILDHDDAKCLLHHFTLPYVPFVPTQIVASKKVVKKVAVRQTEELTLFS